MYSTHVTFCEYFLSTITWIHRCKTQGYKGLTAFIIISIIWTRELVLTALPRVTELASRGKMHTRSFCHFGSSSFLGGEPIPVLMNVPELAASSCSFSLQTLTQKHPRTVSPHTQIRGKKFHLYRTDSSPPPHFIVVGRGENA